MTLIMITTTYCLWIDHSSSTSYFLDIFIMDHYSMSYSLFHIYIIVHISTSEWLIHISFRCSFRFLIVLRISEWLIFYLVSSVDISDLLSLGKYLLVWLYTLDGSDLLQLLFLFHLITNYWFTSVFNSY